MQIDASLLFARLRAESPDAVIYALLGRQEAARLSVSGTSLWYGDAEEGDSAAPRLLQPDPALAARIYDAGAGAFVVAAGDLESVRRHLQSFSAAERDDGTLRTVAIHDPLVLAAFLEVLAAEDAERLFAGITAIAAPRVEDEHLIVWRREPPRIVERAVHLATGWSRERAWTPAPRPPRVEAVVSSGEEPPASGPPRISERQLEAFRSAQIRELIGAPPGVRRSDVPFPLLTPEGEQRIEQALDARLSLILAANLRQHAPEVVAPLSVPDFESMLATALRRARGHGLQERQRIFEFAKLMFVIAPGFDRHPVAQRILGGERGSPDERFARLLETMTYADWQAAQNLFDPRDWELPEIR
jgi:hypothetical protein